MPNIVLNKNRFSIIFILFAGLFVHSFVIYGPGGFNLKLYLLALVLFIFYRAFDHTIHVSKYFMFILPLLGYWFIQLTLLLGARSTLITEHITTMVILMIYLFVLLIIFGNPHYLKDNAVNIYKSIFIIFLIALVLYFVSINIYGIRGFWKMRLAGYDKMENLNTLKNFVHADQAFLPRNSGFHISPNFWGGFCMFAVFILLYIKQIAQISGKWFLLAMGTVVFSLVITFSRGTYIAMIIGGIFYNLPAITNASVKKKIRVFFSFLIIGIILLLSLRFFTDYEKFLTVFKNKTNVEYLKEDARFRIWEYHINAFLEHPFWGEGLQRSKEVFVPTLNPPRESGSHNTMISLLNYMGILGALLFMLITLAIFAVLWNKALKFRSHHLLYRLGMSMLLALFFFCIFEHAFIKMFFWGIIIMAISIAGYIPPEEQMELKRLNKE